MSRLKPLFLSTAALTSLTSLASAAPRPPLGRDQSPPKLVDEAETTIFVGNVRPDGAYEFHYSTRVYGVGSSSDAIRVDWSQKGKVLGSKRCAIPGDGALIDCRYDGKPLTASGAVTAEVFYLDDQTDSAYLLRTYQLTIATFPWGDKKSYQVMGDDLIGTTYAWHDHGGRDSNGRVDFYFWVASAPGEIETKLRCSVDGKKLPDISMKNADLGVIEGAEEVGGEAVNYRWQSLMLQGLWYGLPPEGSPGESDNFLGVHPGDWSCDLRWQGNVARQFRFHVTAEGRIAPHPAQASKDAPAVLDGLSLIDTRIPTDSSLDQRINPDAIRAGMRYGQPWPKDPSIQEMLAALPKATGLPDPGKGGKAKGKKRK
jgi:hypothetical protein